MRWWALAAAVVGLGVAVTVAVIVGSHIDLVLSGIYAPPFYGSWRNRIGATVVAPLAVAAVVIGTTGLQERIGWNWLVLGAAVAALGWSAAIGVSDSVVRLTYQLHSPAEYTRGLDAIGSHPGGYLATFAEATRGPSSEVIRSGYPTHVQGHPPGAVLTLWMVTQLGVSTIHAAIAMVWSGIAVTVVGVLQTVRRLAGEPVARFVAPFVVLLPAAVWSHAFDSYFAAVAALAVWATVAAIVPNPASVGRNGGSRSIVLALIGGVLFGYLGLLSYGLLVMALLPVAVAWRARRLAPLLVAGSAAVVTIAVPAAWGFIWFEGLATTHHQYAIGVSKRRPYGYFVLANLAVVGCAVGPATLAGAIAALRRRRSPWIDGFGRVAPLMVGVVVAVLVADVTGFAKGEVERIFQPMYPWLAIAAIGIAVFPGLRADRITRTALVAQAGVAVFFATQLRSPW